MYLITHLPGQKNKYDSNIADLAKRNGPHFLKYFTLDHNISKNLYSTLCLHEFKYLYANKLKSPPVWFGCLIQLIADRHRQPLRSLQWKAVTRLFWLFSSRAECDTRRAGGRSGWDAMTRRAKFVKNKNQFITPFPQFLLFLQNFASIIFIKIVSILTLQ